MSNQEVQNQEAQSQGTQNKSSRIKECLDYLKIKLIDTGIRAVKTACQTAVAFIGVDKVGIGDVNWIKVIGVSALAAVLCILTNIGNLDVSSYTKEVDEPESPSNDEESDGSNLAKDGLPEVLPLSDDGQVSKEEFDKLAKEKLGDTEIVSDELNVS